MGTTSQKLTYLSETKSQLKTTINYTGAGITNDTFRQYPRKLYNKYVDIIRDGTDTLYSNMPKVETTGTDLTINNTVNTKMALDLKPSVTSQDTLPSEYTAVNYIETAGSNYINTNYYLQSSQLEIKTKIYIPTLPVSAEQDILSNQDGSTNRFVFGVNQSYLFGYSRSGSWSDTNVTTANLTAPNTFEINLKYDYANSLKTLTVNGVTTTQTQAVEIANSNKAIRLLANADSGGNTFIGRLYYLSIKDNGVLVRNFIPCYRNSDSVVGLYDTVNRLFYTNAGSGAFTYGAIATLPNPEQPMIIHTVSGDNEIKIVGRNLFYLGTTDDYDRLTYLDSITENGLNIKYNSSGLGYVTKLQKFKANKTYKVTYTSTKNSNRIMIMLRKLDDSGWLNNSDITISGWTYNSSYHGWYKDIANTNSPIFTISIPNCLYVYFNFFNTSSGLETISNILITTSENTDYTPYTSQTLLLNLGDIELCKISTYEDYFRKVEQKILVPSEYTQLEYIESTGTQYINANYEVKSNTKVEVDFKSNKTSGQSFTTLFGTQNSASSGRYYFMFGSANNYQVNLPRNAGANACLLENGNIAIDDTPATGTYWTNDRSTYILDIANKTAKINNKTWNLSTLTGDYVAPTNVLMLLTRNNAGTADSNCSRGLLYGVKIYEGTTLKRNMIPCYRNSDNEVGLYDLVNNVFYTNAGTGTFNSGVEINKWYLHKEITKYELNGGMVAIDVDTDTLLGARKVLSSSLGGLNNLESAKSTRTAQTSNSNRLVVTNGGGLYIRFLKTDIVVDDMNTVAKMNTWLSNNPIICYWVLYTATDTEITDSTLISQLEVIKSALSYEVQTNITQTNNDLPFIITTSTIKNYDTTI